MPKAKMTIPFGRPWITGEDRDAVARVLDGTILTHGPVCRQFEGAFAEFAGGGKAVTLSSCTAGLHLYYMHLGVGPGDQVILPAMSHVATVHALEITGAKPVFVDCENKTGNMDPALLEDALTPATKAIAPVHFLGLPADMDAIMEFAGRHNLKVLEDCAVGMGTRWRGINVGLFGDGAAFSFYPAKHITAGEGGMFLSKHDEVAGAVDKLRGFHYDKTLAERSLPGIYDVDGLGLNYRMSELQAALGLSQLKRIETILKIRKGNFEGLKERLAGIEDLRIVESADPRAEQSHYLMSLVLTGPLAGKRNDVLLGLKARGVGTGVHYPHPLPRLKYYREKYGYDATRFPNAETIADRSFNLPLGPHVDETAVDYIAQTVRHVLGGIRP